MPTLCHSEPSAMAGTISGIVSKSNMVSMFWERAIQTRASQLNATDILGQVILCWGAVLRAMGCAAAPLPSTPWMPVVPATPLQF